MVIRAHRGKVDDVELRIFEPPRFFEAFLRGRRYTEPPDITARICGICPVAYQMSACLAIENACGVTVDGALYDLRRLLYCGEWIESHALHIYLLHAPDFLGFQSAIEMARDHRADVERGLQLKKVGNEIIATLGGRAVHPVNVRVGGFYRVPTRAELEPLAERLRWARDAAAETARWVASFEFPEFEQDYEFVALRSDDTYPILEGRVASSGGLDIPVDEFEAHIVEGHVARSNALHAHLRGRDPYLTGPLARFNLNYARLSPLAREVARDVELEPPVANPFRSIVVRAVEVVYACDEALRLIAGYEMPDRSAIPVPPRAAVGSGCTEAPRGSLYHRYRIGEDGLIAEARIVPPTSQNQAQIEADLRAFAEPRLSFPTALLTRQCEQAIRNYDPCISCATHFLSLEVV
jgi:sulfhydrogenase subunit alpha